jgi:hypothetical protein
VVLFLGQIETTKSSSSDLLFVLFQRFVRGKLEITAFSSLLYRAKENASTQASQVELYKADKIKRAFF